MCKILLLFLTIICANSHSLSQVIAVAKNAEISRIKELEAQQANLEREAVKSAYMPSLSLKGGYSSINGDRLLISPKESLKGVAVLNFIIYDGGVREARLKALKFSKTAKELRSKQAKNALAFEATTLYFNALNLSELLKAKTHEIGHLKQVKNRLDKFKTAGLASLDESEAINAKLSLSQSDESALRYALKNVLLSIETLTNLKVLQPKNAGIDVSNIASQNVEILALNQELKASEQAYKIVRAQGLPSVFLQDSFMVYKNNYDFGFLGTNFSAYRTLAQKILKENTQRANEITLGFSWKIFDFLQTQKEAQIKRLDTLKMGLNLAYKSRENELKIKAIQNDILALDERILSLSLAVKAAKLSREASARKYEAGLISYSEFLSALSREFEANSSFSIAKNELEIKRASLLFESGEDIESRVVE